jgi:hypothetical protein
MAVKYDITIDQGSEYILNLTLSQNGVGLALSGYAVRGQIRPTIASSTLSATFTGTAIDAGLGQFRISLSASTTTTIVPGQYFYDVELYNGNTITRLMEGKVLVRPEVTR